MKRHISIALFLAILASLTACGGTAGAGTGDDTTAADDTTAEVVKDIYADLPTADHGGMEINILGYYAANAYGDKEFLDAEQTGEVVDDALFQRNTETEERLGVKITFNTENGDQDAYKLFNATVMAGDDTFDMFAIKSYMLGAIISQGTIRPWDGIKGINMEQPWYIQDANETMTFGGRTFGLFSDACGTNITMCWSFIYNKRLAEEWQVKDLYQTVYDGKWTMDKVTELTKDVWVDVNGDSKPDAGDVYGLYTDKWATLDAFMLSHDIHALTKDKDDLLVVDFYNDRVVESFEKVYSLYWENPGTYVDLTAPYNYVKNFAAGQGLFSPMYIQYLIEGDMREMKDEYGVLPYPKLNEEQEDYETYLLARFGMLALPMTLTAEKEAVIGEFTEVWSALSHKYLTPALYDVSLTAKGTRDEESIKMLEMIMDSRSYCFSTSLQYGWAFPFTQDKTYRNLIGSSKTKDITSFYESNRETADKYIEDLVAKLEDVING